MLVYGRIKKTINTKLIFLKKFSTFPEYKTEYLRKENYNGKKTF